MTGEALRSTAVQRIAGVAVLLIAASALPFFVSDYRTFQFTLVISYAITLLGLNILTGYNGQISLGHGAFFAIGAYTAAIMMDRWDLPYWSTIPAAGLTCLITRSSFRLKRKSAASRSRSATIWSGSGWAIRTRPIPRRLSPIPSTRPGRTRRRASGCPAII
jgi:hypothetical protein